MKVKILFLASLFVLNCSSMFSQRESYLQQKERLGKTTKKVEYKIVGKDTLNMYVIYPDGMKKNEKRPAIVFFFGGGWIGGNITQFEPQAKYLASRGMISILADYRVRSRNNTTPFDAVADAKSAIRYLRSHAAELKIDPSRIVASGGSAGGHIAAAAGIIKGLDEKGEDTTVSSKPNALVLFNPVFDNGPNGYGYDRIGDRYKEISPYHNIGKNEPPTIVFLGTNDRLIPVKTAQSFCEMMKENGNRCELFLYEGQGHGFFNQKEYSDKTLYQADKFLVSLGYLKGKPTIENNPGSGKEK